MSEKRRISKTGAELQDIVELLDQTTGQAFIPFSAFSIIAGTPAVTAVGGAVGAGYAFDAASEESVITVLRVPDSLPALDTASTVDVYIQWSAAATSGDVIWDLTYVAVNLGEDVGGGGTAAQVTDTVAGTADYLSEAPVISIAASALANADLLFLKISRKAAEAGDTMAGDASLQGLRIAYTTNPKIV